MRQAFRYHVGFCGDWLTFMASSTLFRFKGLVAGNMFVAPTISP